MPYPTSRHSVLMFCLLIVPVSTLVAPAQTKKPPPVQRRAPAEQIVPQKYDVSATVRPEDPSMTIRALIDTVKVMRNTPITSLTVELSPGLALIVPSEPKPDSELDVKPDPVILWLEVDQKGAMQLNREARGTLTNLAPMGNDLVNIFRDREENGVFRDGKNEIEKTVWLSLHPDLKVSDLEKAAGMLQVAGCDQIMFAVDGPLFTDRRKLIETFPLTPAGKP